MEYRNFPPHSQPLPRTPNTRRSQRSCLTNSGDLINKKISKIPQNSSQTEPLHNKKQPRKPRLKSSIKDLSHKFFFTYVPRHNFFFQKEKEKEREKGKEKKMKKDFLKNEILVLDVTKELEINRRNIRNIHNMIYVFDTLGLVTKIRKQAFKMNGVQSLIQRIHLLKKKLNNSKIQGTQSLSQNRLEQKQKKQKQTDIRQYFEKYCNEKVSETQQLKDEKTQSNQEKENEQQTFFVRSPQNLMKQQLQPNHKTNIISNKIRKEQEEFDFEEGIPINSTLHNNLKPNKTKTTKQLENKNNNNNKSQKKTKNKNKKNPNDRKRGMSLSEILLIIFLERLGELLTIREIAEIHLREKEKQKETSVRQLKKKEDLPDPKRTSETKTLIRRFYDIVGILEGISLVEKEKKCYRWNDLWEQDIQDLELEAIELSKEKQKTKRKQKEKDEGWNSDKNQGYSLSSGDNNGKNNENDRLYELNIVKEKAPKVLEKLLNAKKKIIISENFQADENQISTRKRKYQDLNNTKKRDQIELDNFLQIKNKVAINYENQNNSDKLLYSRGSNSSNSIDQGFLNFRNNFYQLTKNIDKTNCSTKLFNLPFNNKRQWKELIEKSFNISLTTNLIGNDNNNNCVNGRTNNCLIKNKEKQQLKPNTNSFFMERFSIDEGEYEEEDEYEEEEE
ncbi:hypothetical protein M0812_16035 [Anaeramoeba flamelloides]|uniref:E2F/DP family winged-helix DNA-binding domain-containing protein n=1 Tax=Anaeramoeba flamelloides TaxID=1746091 RepID=A0AAV7ZJJ5_9EUKA|nr:hypothetical protein M0812_16035 [Anaeramoeba flamelloides]